MPLIKLISRIGSSLHDALAISSSEHYSNSEEGPPNVHYGRALRLTSRETL